MRLRMWRVAWVLLFLHLHLSCGEVRRDVREGAIRDYLVDSRELAYVTPNFVHVGLILAGIRGVSDTKRLIIRKLEEMVKSILSFSRGTRAHFIVFTDAESRPHVTAVFRNELGRFLSESVILDRRVVSFPLIRVEHVDMAAMVDRHRGKVDQMKKLFGYHHPEGTVIKSSDGGPDMLPTLKYTKDLFYIAPLLHQELPHDLKKLIMLDIDLEFRIDLLDLYKQFHEFSETEMIGLASELSPHYYNQARRYIGANPGTRVGRPGRFQGFNTGVALYHLQRMRGSEEYGEEVEVARMRELSHGKYQVAGTVGDQDWLTILGWESPHLFHLLPCTFNIQTHEGYKTPTWASVWNQYRNCTDKPKIIHHNGSFWSASVSGK